MTNVRCEWCEADPLYIAYHDREWGVPVKDDQKLFEFLVLETFQAGLSWITVLRKRENFRQAFDNFDFTLIANYGEEKLSELLDNKWIIRNRLKIRATATNAQAFLKVREELGSFSNYIWSFVDHQPIVNRFKKIGDLPSKTPLSDKISADLKRRGFKFTGSMVVYSYLQATGMVNDHLIDCFRHDQLVYK